MQKGVGMSIQLFEHNQIAYESAVAMLNEEGRAAVIHPTGTGKSFIAFKLAQDQPDARICWLSPSEYIFNTQRENIQGGLMALYGATVYNHIFQRAACLSPSLWVSSGKVLEMVARAHVRRDTCIYLDYGSEEMFNHAANAEALISTSHLLLTKRVNLAFRIVPGGTHCEASWEKQIPIFMDCLGL